MNELLSSKHHDNLKMYVNDVIGVERDIVNAFKNQLDSDGVKAHSRFAAVLSRLVTESEHRILELQQISEREGGSIGAAIKEAAMSITGTLAGIYGKLREHPLSRMLRDDRIALNVTETSYAMLLTLALGVGDSQLAELARRGLSSAAGGVLDLTDLLPGVILEELAKDGPLENPDAAPAVLKEIRAAWAD